MKITFFSKISGVYPSIGYLDPPALGVNTGKDIKTCNRLKVSFWSILEGSKKIFDFN